MTSYLWRVEFTLQDDTSIWSAKDFIASLEFLDAYEVAKEFLKQDRGTGKEMLDLNISKLERGTLIDEP